MSEITRIVVLGKTGAGKSSVANTIFGQKVFEVYSGANSGTTHCQSFTGEVNGRRLKWIDTPGLFDTGRSKEEMNPEIVKCIAECAPGPHVFLIILKVERFTEHEEGVIKKINDYFSDQALKFAIVFFTHGDDLEEGDTIEHFVRHSKGLRELMEKCGERCHVLDNRYWKESQDVCRSNQYQLSELLKTMDKMIQANNGGYYTNNFLQQSSHKLMALAYSCTVGALMMAFLGRAILEEGGSSLAELGQKMLGKTFDLPLE